MRKTLLLSSLIFSFLFLVQLAFADTPSVVSFSASRAFITSNQPLGFSWSIQNGVEPKITFNCPSGVRLWKSDGITSIPCNTALVFGTQGVNVTSFSDAVDLIVTNTSGTTKTLGATLTPIDGAGVVYPALTQTILVSVQTDPEPFLLFSAATVSSSDSDIVLSGQPIIFSWKTRGTSGVNILMSCNDGVTATSSVYNSGQVFPCGMNIFSPDRPAESSLTLGLYNRRSENVAVKFTILPAMETGMYDATHAKNVTITVRPYVPPTISVISFDSSDKAYFGTPFPISWNVSGVSAVNLKTSCMEAITIALAGTSTPVGACGNYIFSLPVPSASSTILIFNNTSNSIQQVLISVIPSKGDGTYDATNSRTKTITVYPKGTQSQVTTPILPVTTPISAGQGQGGTPTVSKYKFTKALSFGSRNSEVTDLQKFLKNYPDLYPEGLVTGYFGPASVRAIKKFQEKYGIANAGGAGYGFVGPKTRAKLNEF